MPIETAGFKERKICTVGTGFEALMGELKKSGYVAGVEVGSGLQPGLSHLLSSFLDLGAAYGVKCWGR